MSNLKLKELLPVVRVRLERNKRDLEMYKELLKKEGDYKDFDIYFSAMVRDITFLPQEICEWYDKYKATDKNIIALFKSVLKEMEVL